jgi:hypothetical protein
LIPNFEQVIVLIEKNPHLTFFKWTPHQVSPVISMPDATGSMEGHCINGLIVDGKDCMAGSFPAQCTYFPPLPMHPYNDEEMPKVLTAIFRGIYLIDPSATVENCFNVIYSVDGTKTIRMGSFMDLGFASITEWYVYATNAIQFNASSIRTDNLCTQLIIHREPAVSGICFYIKKITIRKNHIPQFQFYLFSGQPQRIIGNF